jgi:predicted phosphodiesterase
VRKILVGVALLGVGLLFGVPVATSTFVHSERHLTIGAHQAVVDPAFGGHATLDFGPLLPRARVPLDAPLGIGVDIRLGDSDAVGLEELLQRDAAIAAQPEGEVREVTSAVTDMAADAALRGLGVGVLAVTVVVLAWRAVGPERRRRLAREATQPTRGQVAGGAATVLVVVGSLVMVTLPERQDAPAPTDWSPVREVFPELPADPVLDRLELAEGSATTSSRALVEGALYLYRDSVSFYGALEEQAQQVRLREPEEGERTALVVTDRHDNIGMDPVARRIADQAQARLLIDLGDDTSQGGEWENFSINSLAREFDGFDVVAVGGNHDADATTARMREVGFRVLDGEPVEVGGVRFLGETDPRGTTIAGYTEDEATRATALADQDVALRDTACEADERGERVSVLAVHSWASAKEVAASGCVDLVLTGHLHYQVGPKAIAGPDGATTTRLTTGSTGGAVLPIALGSSLRRDAQVSVVTFDADGAPVGLQVVTFTPAGVIDVGEYTPLPLTSAPAPAEPDPTEDPTADDEDPEAPVQP